MSDQRLLTPRELHDIRHFRLGAVLPLPYPEMRDIAVKLFWHQEAQAAVIKELTALTVHDIDCENRPNDGRLFAPGTLTCWRCKALELTGESE